MGEITVILNGFKRGKNIKRQIRALKEQTIPPKEIMLWYNSPGKWWKFNLGAIKNVDKAAISTHNFGVWSRFTFALNANTKYICMLDDDIIPGKKWFENCLKTMTKQRGLLGGHGLCFTSSEQYFDNKTNRYNYTRHGWPAQNEETKQVDIVGHAWFFEKQWLHDAFFREDRLYPLDRAGEDMHFSYTLQKYLGLSTFVPEHPKNDLSLWSNIDGAKVGTDKNAISTQHINNQRFTFLEDVNKYFKKCIENGWKLVTQKDRLDKSFAKDFDHILSLLKNKTPFAISRFGDGEMFILQNKDFVLGDFTKVGEEIYNIKSLPEDKRHFIASEHQMYRDKLLASFQCKKDNYFVAIACRCCVGQINFDWMVNNTRANLTWANLLLNANYHRFINEMYPLFNEYKTVVVCNEKADLKALPFVVKDFRVGYNAMINDYHKIDEIANWISENNITGHLFLLSASSFTKLAIHELYRKFPNNTYIDIGTALNAFIGMDISRSYLKGYWLDDINMKAGDLAKVCIW